MLANITRIAAIAFMMTDCTKRKLVWCAQDSGTTIHATTSTSPSGEGTRKWKQGHSHHMSDSNEFADALF